MASARWCCHGKACFSPRSPHRGGARRDRLIGMPATDVMASPSCPALSVCAGDVALDEGGISRHVTQICLRFERSGRAASPAAPPRAKLSRACARCASPRGERSLPQEMPGEAQTRLYFVPDSPRPRHRPSKARQRQQQPVPGRRPTVPPRGRSSATPRREILPRAGQRAGLQVEAEAEFRENGDSNRATSSGAISGSSRWAASASAMR